MRSWETCDELEPAPVETVSDITGLQTTRNLVSLNLEIN